MCFLPLKIKAQINAVFKSVGDFPLGDSGKCYSVSFDLVEESAQQF